METSEKYCIFFWTLQNTGNLKKYMRNSKIIRTGEYFLKIWRKGDWSSGRS